MWCRSETSVSIVMSVAGARAKRPAIVYQFSSQSAAARYNKR